MCCLLCSDTELAKRMKDREPWQLKIKMIVEEAKQLCHLGSSEVLCFVLESRPVVVCRGGPRLVLVVLISAPRTAAARPGPAPPGCH